MDDLVDDLPSMIAAKVAEILRPGEKVLVQLRGAFKEALICTDSRCLIIKAGFMTGNTFGSNVFQLPYANVTSAEVKFGLLSGYFELSSGGVQNTVKSYWNNSRGPADAKAAPNSVSLTQRKMADKFNRAAEFILDRVSKAKSAPFGGTSGGSSVADELAKLAALLEKGYLSKEEFDTQKRTILARDETPQVPDGEPLVFSEPDESQRPQDRIDEVIAEELHKREAEQKGAQSTRPTFGRRPPRP